MIIDEERIIADFSKIKKLIFNALCKNKYNLCMEFLEYASNLMYNSNIVFEDIELESVVSELAYKLRKKINLSSSEYSERRIVFYDYFVYDNRGLTEQYLEALELLNYKILFVSNVKPSKSSENIFKKLFKNPNIEVYILKETDYFLRAQELAEKVLSFCAKTVLCHISPWDSSGIVAMNSLCGLIDRYLINLTDHAFWLGTQSFDFYLEFRSFGVNISNQYRNINPSKCLYLPFYPVVNENIDFEGFDFNVDGKRIIFSGGSLVKIQGSNVFLDLVKYLLDKYPDIIFLYLGNGDSFFIEKFIKDNHFENKFYYRRERKDIFQVFKHCFLYLNTYPVTGGLMTQYACICGKPPLTLNDKYDHDDDIMEMIPFCKADGVMASSLDEMKAYFDLYLTDDIAYRKVSNSVINGVISKEKFASLLDSYLLHPINLVEYKKYDLDSKTLSKSYISRLNENNGIPYFNLFLKKNIFFTMKFFLYSLRAFAYRIISKIIKK